LRDEKTDSVQISAGLSSIRHYLFLAMAVVMWTAMSIAGQSVPSGLSARDQQRVAELIQEAIGPYRTNVTTKPGTTNRPSENSIRVEASFREASRLMPERLDLRFMIATALIGQALQTNTLLELKMKQALAVYQQIWAMDTNGFEAPILYAAYMRAMGDTNASEAAIKQLMSVYPERTREFVERFGRVDAFLEIVPNETISKSAPKTKEHAIVILGAMLETNGVIKPKLVGRLKQALKLARAYPNAPIILTGGNQKSGITEAYAMSLWLRRRGISPKRLHLDDLARDTVGNAIFSSTILEKLGVTDVTVVTSVNHIRRGLVDLQEACLQRGLKLYFANLGASGEPESDKKSERVSTYRDAMRISGLWAYPGILR